MRIGRVGIAGLVFWLGWIVNPAYLAGCLGSSEDAEWEFGEAEMLDVVSAANDAGPFEFEVNGTRYQLALRLVQRGGPEQERAASPMAAPFSGAVARACGHRTFTNSAAACLWVSHVPLTATLNLDRLDGLTPNTLIADGTTEGELWALGKRLNGGQIDLSASGFRLRLRVEQAEHVTLDELWTTLLDTRELLYSRN